MADELRTNLDRLIARHRLSGVAVDTNLLVLWFVGTADPALINRHKRTYGFSMYEFRLLEGLLARFDRIVTTPNIMTETVNHLMQTDAESKAILLGHVKARTTSLHESYFATKQLIEIDEFPEMGLTDSGLLRAARRGRLVLSSDFKLCGMIETGGGPVINFNHLRSRLWE